MKFRFLPLIACCLLVAMATACYTTQEGRLKAGLPGKDRIVSRYEAPFQRVYDAAVEVLKENGTLTNDDRVTKVLRGRIDANTVWISFDDSEPRLTTMTVQVRSGGGAPNVDMASEVDKLIYGRLITQ